MTGPDVFGPGEIADHLMVTLQRVRQLAARPDFPKPRQLGIGKVWDAPAVRAWQIARIAPRRAKIVTVHKSYVHGGKSIARAARRADVPYSTARGWLREIGALE